ncbi:hypothetical protein [Microbacterium sediminis]|uniref:Uncharacterized protein n=1 Tax=Microbacterium sediminis TaxID=904291 RepID=A0A1B9NDY4_9MICO|nr:hypothetical protein [Microbacterium sediminis]OCG74807.1 hypothetical protein A7J15_04630 [Microbacterium sediminis]
MIAPALDMLRTAGLILLRRGWLMALIYAVGAAAQFGLLQVVGRIGAYDAVAGMLLLPLPILARLTALVGMLLVVRGELEYLGRLAPLPTDRRERRAALGRALLGGIVPFMAFYLTWGYLAGDVADYANIALLERERVDFEAFAEHMNSGSTEEFAPRDWGFIAGDLPLGPVAIGILVVAFSLRWALGRWGQRFGAWGTIAKIYLEALWVLITALTVADLVELLTAWVDGRLGMVWLRDVTGWIAEFLAPVAWAWESLLWLIEQIGLVLLEPAAWLAIAGTIYGQAVKAQAPELSGRYVDRWKRLDGTIKRWLSEGWNQVAGRFTPIWNAVVLAWRAGPVLIAAYAFLNTLTAPLEPYLSRFAIGLVGPHDEAFWRVWAPLLSAVPSMVVQTVLITLAAAAYDSALEARALRDAAAAGPALPENAPMPANTPPRPRLPGATEPLLLPAGAPLPPGVPVPPSNPDGIGQPHG